MKAVKIPHFPRWMDLITRAHCLAALSEYENVAALALRPADLEEFVIWAAGNPYPHNALEIYGDALLYDCLLDGEDLPKEPEEAVKAGVMPGSIIVFAVSIHAYPSHTEYGTEWDEEAEVEIIKIIPPRDAARQLERCLMEAGAVLIAPK